MKEIMSTMQREEVGLILTAKTTYRYVDKPIEEEI